MIQLEENFAKSNEKELENLEKEFIESYVFDTNDLGIGKLNYLIYK